MRKSVIYKTMVFAFCLLAICRQGAGQIKPATAPPGGGLPPGGGGKTCPEGTIHITSTATAICPGTSVEFSSTYTATSGTLIAFEWYVNGVGSGSNSTYTSSSLTNGTTVYCQLLISQSGCSTTVVNSNTIQITVYPPLTNNISISPTSQVVYTGQTPATMTVSAPSGGNGVYTYQWLSSTNANSWTSISGATASTYTPPAPTGTGTLYYIVQVGSNCGFSENSANYSTVFVYSPLVPGTISPSSQNINYNTGATLQMTGNSGGNGAYTYQWDSSASASGPFSPISGATSPAYSTGPLTAMTYYELNVSSNGSTAATNVATINVYPQLISGTISPSAQTINNNTAPASLNISAPSGGNGTYTYQWESCTTINGVYAPISGAAGTSYSPGTMTSTLYYEVVTTSNGATVTSSPASVTVTLIGGTIGGAPSAIVPYDTTVTLTSVQNAGGGSCSNNYNYQWFESPDGITFLPVAGATGNTYTAQALTSTTYFYRTATCNGQSVSSNTVVIQVGTPLNPGAIIPSAMTISPGSGPGLLTANPATGGNCGGNYAYQWQQSPDGINFTATSVTTQNYSPGALTSTTWYRRRTICGADTVYTNVSTITTGTVTTNDSLNYIRIRTLARPGITDTVTSDQLTSATDVRQITQYFDGLNRPIQIVNKQASPLQDDIVSINVYDQMGHETTQYLPYTSPSGDGNYKINALGEQNNFNAAQYPTDHFYYGQTNYEPSPLNRVTAALPAGDSWIGSGRGRSRQYLINTIDDSVEIWNIAFAQGSLPVNAGIYGAGQLYKMVSADEQGAQEITYKDKKGRIVLKRAQSAANPGTAHVGWHNTYYIYDDADNLRYVIQPRAVELINTTGIWTLTQAIANELCFRYEYDQLNRIIIRKVPGAGAVWMVYDARNRVVMTQDSALRTLQKWTFIRYDGLNRSDSTGLITDPANYNNLAYHQNLASASASYPNLSGYTTELLTQAWYDNYSWVTGAMGGISATIASNYTSSASYFITGYNTSPTYAVPIAASNMTQGSVTGSMTKVAGTASQYLYSVSFYDDRNRVVQVQSVNYTGAVDTLTTQYAFTGNILRTLLNHRKSGNTAQNHVVVTKLTYDAMLRLKSIYKNIDGAAADQLIDSLQYTELGRLNAKYIGSNKTTGAPLDSLVYAYNIRGWLTGINKNYLGGTTNHYFGMELGYDNPNSIIGTTSYQNPIYNGNVAGTIWKSAGDAVGRKYDLRYDNSGRLTAAAYLDNKNGSWGATMMDFSVSNLAYDANGNILSMNQHGFKIGAPTGEIDSLTYTYQPNSNKLSQVIDAANDSASTLGDFHYSPSTKGPNDYSYDGNGNLVMDNNKRIGAITYNYLNLPQIVHFSGKGNIAYTYDARGNKLLKVTTDSIAKHSTTTLYIDGFVYQQTDTITSPGGGTDTLQFMAHEEGRARWAFHKYLNGATAYGWEYDFYEKDHLGNTRVLLSQQRDTAQYLATMEAAYRSTENALFYNIPTTSYPRASVPGYPDDVSVTNPNDSVARVNGNGPKVGPAIILKVMSGDQVDIGANYYYNSITTANGQTLSPADLINSLAGGIVQLTGGLHGSLSQLTGSSSPLTGALQSFLNTRNGTTTGKPNAYLNWVLLDDQFNYVGTGGQSGALPVGSAGTTSGGGLQTPLAKTGIPITTSGYLYIYVSNATPGWDVFFDNLSVKHYSGPLVEENHYYPFGLTMAALSDKAIKTSYAENKSRYNDGSELQNKEFSDGTGFEMYETSFRSFDPQLGRFAQIDPLADKYQFFSTYQYALNNPIYFNDPSGSTISALDAIYSLWNSPYGGTWNAGDGDVDYFASEDEAFGYGAAGGGGGPGWGSQGVASSFNAALARYNGGNLTDGMVEGYFEATWQQTGQASNISAVTANWAASYQPGNPTTSDNADGFNLSYTATSSGNSYTTFYMKGEIMSLFQQAGEGLQIAENTIGAVGFAWDLTNNSITGAQMLANTLSGTTYNVVNIGEKSLASFGNLGKLTGEAAGKALGGFGIAVSLYDMTQNGANPSNVTDAIMGGVAFIPVVGWAISGIYFVANFIVEEETGSSIGEHVYDAIKGSDK